MATYGNTAITIGSLKSASLYFDYVVPVNLGLEVMPRKGDPVHPGPLGLRPLPNLREMVPHALLDNPTFIKRLGSVNAATANLIRKFSAERFGFEPKIQGMSNAEYAAIEDTAVGAFYRFVEEFNSGGLPLDCGGGVPSGDEELTGESIM